MFENVIYTSLARGEGETFEAYKARRKAMKAAEKAVLKGNLFHDSNRYGTYTNKVSNPEKHAAKLARKARGIRK